jgi:hypothetical protein
MRLEGIGKLKKKKKIHLIGTRTRYLPACSVVPQPTTLPRAHNFKTKFNTYASFHVSVIEDEFSTYQ